MEITLSEIFNNDLRLLGKLNKLAENSELPLYFDREKGKSPLCKYDYTLVQPDTNNLGDHLDTSPEMIRFRKAEGYKKAQEVFKFKK